MSTSRWIAIGCFAFLSTSPATGSAVRDGGDESSVDVRVMLDEADAVLGLLDKRAEGEELGDADWQLLHATEGYRRLRARDESFGVERFDESFRDWVFSVEVDTIDQLRGGVDRWRSLDASDAGRVALAYLPTGTRLQATIYPVLKPKRNSFVFEVDTDPAIFMYVSGEAAESELANTLAHELHHIGTSAGCPEAREEPSSESAGQVLRWMGAFAEGIAMLAAAGGSDVHPHASREAGEWIVWERDIARFSEDLSRIETFFLEILSGKLDEEAQRPRFFELVNTPDVPQGPFYTVGWKMGALVEQRFGRSAVIDAVCDMRRLLVAYNQIVHENPRDDGGKLPAWSPELLRAIGAADVVGTWRARPEHNGQVGDFVIRFELDAEGALQAAVSLPPLGAWDIVALPAEVSQDAVKIGGWVLRREPDGSLSGVLPPSLVPVHEISLTLRRSDPIEPPSSEPITAPVAEPVWTRRLGEAIWAGIATGDGLVYVGDDSGRLTALDSGTGTTRWQYATGGAVRARPTLTESAIYVHSDDGYLHVLTPDSGELLWRASVAAERIERVALGAANARYNHYASSALQVGKTVFVGGFDGHLYALDAASGEERWRFAAADTIAGTPAVADDRLVFGSFDGNVYAVDAATGAELWRHDAGAAVVSSPLIHEGRGLIGNRAYDLLALDVETGEPDWEYYYWFSWVESSAVERGGVAYVGSSDGQLVVALDAVTGAELWRFDSGGSPWSQPATTDSALFIGTVGVADYMVAHEATLWALDRGSGEARWQYPLQRPGDAAHWGFGASVAVDERMVFAATLDGEVLAFQQSR